jgi:hypothetical protein
MIGLGTQSIPTTRLALNRSQLLRSAPGNPNNALGIGGEFGLGRI